MIIKPEYLAGLFDGEGNISLYPFNHRNKPNNKNIIANMAICNNHFDVINAINKQYGGKMYSRTTGRLIPNYRIHWTTISELIQILDAIQPHLLIKSDQASVMRSYLNRREIGKRKRHTEIDFDLCNQMIALNAKYRTNKNPNFVPGDWRNQPTKHILFKKE